MPLLSVTNVTYILIKTSEIYNLNKKYGKYYNEYDAKNWR